MIRQLTHEPFGNINKLKNPDGISSDGNRRITLQVGDQVRQMRKDQSRVFITTMTEDPSSPLGNPVFLGQEQLH